MTDFPYSGRAKPPREPVFFIPVVVVALVAALLAIHAVLVEASPAVQDALVRDFSFMPGRLTLAIWPQRLGDLLARVNSDPEALARAAAIRHYRVIDGGAKVWTLLTYALLHGSWTHVGINSIWLIAFGPPVARRFGAARFLAFFALTAIAGALAHWVAGPMDFSPLIGASAADSGLMAAATRFIFQPGAPLGASQSLAAGRFAARGDAAAPSLMNLLRERRAVTFIVIWMGTNFVFGAGAQALGASEAPVAWIAHVGGFVVGLLAFPLFDRR